jgi:hypothetical protein
MSLACLTGTHAQSNVWVRGQVTEQQSRQPLPFVSVVIKGTTYGTTTDTLGNFVLKLPSYAYSITFSLLGYQTLEQKAGPTMQVTLNETTHELAEVIVTPGENPAHYWIRMATENRDRHNPEKLPAFSYQAYQKITFASEDYQADTLRNKQSQWLNKTLKNSYLFINETLSARTYTSPGLHRETIQATQTSGTQSTFVATLLNDIQVPSFYQDFVQIGKNGEYYNLRNPISKGSTHLYEFTLTDTLIHSRDSIFVITFHPRKGRTPTALQGVVHIHSSSFAITYLKASPADPYRILSFTTEQTYQPIGEQWFVTQSHTRWTYKKNRLLKYPLTADHLWQVSDIHTRETPYTDTPNGIARTIAPDAARKEENFWRQYRMDTLSQREKNTYETYRNLSSFKKFAFRNALNYAEWQASGVIPLGKFQVPIVYFLGGNLYEGARAGMGLQTSPSFSKTFQWTGYAAYGLLDNAWKWGTAAQLILNEAKDVKLRAAYRQDVWEPANVEFFKDQQAVVIPYEQVRNFLVARADSLQQFKAELSFSAVKHGRVFVGVLHESRTPTYDYFFSHPVNVGDGMAMMNSQTFRISEASVGFRYAFGEEFTQVGNGRKLSKPARYTFLVHVAQGLNRLGGEYTYTKLNAKFETVWHIRKLGQLFVNLSAGSSWGNLPYPYLYSGRGSLSKAGNLLWVANHFQTMGVYEFVSDTYANAFLTHNFGKIFPLKTSFFQPDVSLIHSFGIGSLRHAGYHQKIVFQTMDKGFYETGLTVDNLLRVRVLKLFYLGAGGGVFRRWGAYAFENRQQNWAFRVVWNVSI